ncbi:MAG: cryptochrome/photolyase family protein [Gammaproteobacteria bacterium]|nr:cryptochrome/photolyase family protein [Gammaproteobacteria bacterium]
MGIRNLVLVLGDQLDPQSLVFDDIDKEMDMIWMAELAEESEHVWSHKVRIALFFSAMRHFAKGLEKLDIPVRYLAINAHTYSGFTDALGAEIATYQPERVVVVQPGDYRVLKQLRDATSSAGLPLDVRPNRQFLIDLKGFQDWARDRKTLRLEHFYRYMRRRMDLLMDGKNPQGGAWNFDKENRKTFKRKGPGLVPSPASFAPDVLTQAVIADVQERFPDHPGSLTHFDWPVTPEQAEEALQDFVMHRLAAFGPYQDALWTGETYLYHSRLSAAMNLGLLDPQTVLDAAVAAYRRGTAPLASVEGFVRQIVGWREFIRGLYWTHMPDYLAVNSLDAHQALPTFFWTGKTDMLCLAETIGQTLEYGYAHHIQRLMITGLFALLLGVEPRQVHAWYLAVYVDAVEWVELPNVLGMSQFADGGLIASKPYAASGKYIQRMSNYCEQCPYDPNEATGELACPFTTLYWDFLMRHEARFKDHPRAALQWRNLSRLDEGRRALIRKQAGTLIHQFASSSS